MHSASQPILDYASPRKHSRIRLPALSQITTTSDGPGHIAILEELKGKSQAIGSIVFACLTLLIITLVGVAEFRRSDSWRKTLIEVQDGTLTLTFSSLFSRATYSWPLRTLRSPFSSLNRRRSAPRWASCNCNRQAARWSSC